jgi:hypothetical protein
LVLFRSNGGNRLIEGRDRGLFGGNPNVTVTFEHIPGNVPG